MMTTGEVASWVWRVAGVVFGLLWGSFLNVVIYRVPAGLSVVTPGSHCPSCQQPVKAYDNVPVLSWVWLRGRSRCCQTPISIRYPLVELLGGLLAWAIVETVVLRLPPGTALGHAVVVFLVDLALALGLTAASFIDLEHMYLPDAITLGGAAVGWATTWLRPPLTYVETLMGAASGFLMVWLPFDVLYRALRGKTGMALGDAKLVMLAGAWFGLPGAFFALMAGAVQGALCAIGLLLIQGKIEEPAAVVREREALLAEVAALPPAERAAAERELAADPIFEPTTGALGARIPFGPFLALAILEYLFFGDALVSFLLSSTESLQGSPGPSGFPGQLRLAFAVELCCARWDRVRSPPLARTNVPASPVRGGRVGRGRRTAAVGASHRSAAAPKQPPRVGRRAMALPTHGEQMDLARRHLVHPAGRC